MTRSIKKARYNLDPCSACEEAADRIRVVADLLLEDQDGKYNGYELGIANEVLQETAARLRASVAEAERKARAAKAADLRVVTIGGA